MFRLMKEESVAINSHQSFSSLNQNVLESYDSMIALRSRIKVKRISMARLHYCLMTKWKPESNFNSSSLGGL